MAGMKKENALVKRVNVLLTLGLSKTVPSLFHLLLSCPVSMNESKISEGRREEARVASEFLCSLNISGTGKERIDRQSYKQTEEENRARQNHR